jgi:hypothetical protein
MKSILLIGLHPSVVDFANFPGLTAEKLAAGLKAQEEALRSLGFDVSWCLTDLGETAEAVVRDAAKAKPHAAVLIGAGVRVPPPHFMLFEKLINVVHEHAPQAKLCFNTRPDDTVESVLRWVQPG